MAKEKQYIPTCPAGYCNCVCDPAYIRLKNPELYKDIYGTQTPEQAVAECSRWTEEEPEPEME